MAPFALVLWLTVDMLLRVAGLPEVRPLHRAIRHFSRYAPFLPGLQIHYDNFVGEVAIEANLPPSEGVRSLTFSTNRLGFRANPEYPESEPPDVLVLNGDSFIFGSGLSDEETFPAALTRISGLRAFNAGRFHVDPDGLPELDWLLEHLPGKPRTALFVYLENQDYSRSATGISGALSSIRQALPRQAGHAVFTLRTFHVWGQTSPLEIISRRFFKSISNDRILPNPFKNAIRILPLPAGGPMLIGGYEMGPASTTRGQAEATAYADHLEWWRTQLSNRGMEMAVLIIPTRYTVYAPVIEEASRRAGAVRARSFLHMFEAELMRRGLTTVDATRLFEASLDRELRTGSLSFFRDDNHWNGAGVELVAQSVAEALQKARAARDPAGRFEEASRH